MHSDIFCIGNERWVPFFEGILEELAELFPSRWVHMGGDEVPFDQWAACPRCKAILLNVDFFVVIEYGHRQRISEADLH